MPFEYEVAVRVLPDPKSLKQFAKDVQDSVGEIAVTAREAGSRVAGAGKGVVPFLTTIAKYLAPVSAVALLLQNKFSGLGEYLKMIVDILMLFLKPIADLLMVMLRPLILFLLKLAVLWIKFWQDPIGNIKKAVEGLFSTATGAVGKAKEVAGAVVENAVETAQNILNTIKQAFEGTPFGEIIDEAVGKWKEGLSKIGTGVENIKNGFSKIMEGDFLGGLSTVAMGFVQTLSGMLTVLGATINAVGQAFVVMLHSAFTGIWRGLTHLFESVIVWLRNAWTTIVKKLIEVGSTAVKWVEDTIRGILSAIRAKAEEIINGAKRTAERIVSSVKGVLGIKQHGGIIPRTGLYLMHEGEVVGRPTTAPNITLNITVNGTADKDIVDEIARRVMMELRRVSRW